MQPPEHAGLSLVYVCVHAQGVYQNITCFKLVQIAQPKMSRATPFWLLASSSKEACSSSGESTWSPLLPPDKLRKGRLASDARTPR